jgi:hypothetical protein
MGGTVLDRRRRDELEGVFALGRLAEQMVFTLGRVVRQEELLPDDEAVLEAARQLFELMATEDVIVINVAGNRMINDDSYLDALHVFERTGEDVEARADRYVELLSKAANGTVTSEEREELSALRELFAEVGEATLARANDLSRPHQEPSWQLMRPATLRF